jgi:hypothetical protein
VIPANIGAALCKLLPLPATKAKWGHCSSWPILLASAALVKAGRTDFDSRRPHHLATRYRSASRIISRGLLRFVAKMFQDFPFEEMVD